MLEVFEVACLVCMAVIGIAATVIVILNNTNVASSTVHIMHCCINAFSVSLLAVYVSAYFMLDPLELIYGGVLRVVTPAALLVLAIAHLARLGATINELNHKVQLLKCDAASNVHVYRDCCDYADVLRILWAHLRRDQREGHGCRL